MQGNEHVILLLSLLFRGLKHRSKWRYRGTAQIIHRLQIWETGNHKWKSVHCSFCYKTRCRSMATTDGPV